ncbi:MAG: fumarylacetoacetate hydrolase family protein [Bacteroidota bacterium]
MKIICIGRNYAKHIEELKNEKPENPVVFLKPDTALLKNNEPFYHPSFSNDVHHELELTVKIDKPGKHVEEKFAHKYYSQIGLGIDFTARDLQSEFKEKRLPWDLAKGFNGAAPISEFREIKKGEDLKNLNLELKINGEQRQIGNTSNMLFSIDLIISYVSKFIQLKTGDIIFTGTPEGVGPVKSGDRLEGYLESEKLLDFEVK